MSNAVLEKAQHSLYQQRIDMRVQVGVKCPCHTLPLPVVDRFTAQASSSPQTTFFLLINKFLSVCSIRLAYWLVSLLATKSARVRGPPIQSI